MQRHVIVHTLGHRDLYLQLKDTWYRPASHGQHPLGLALKTLGADRLRPEPPACVALDPPWPLPWTPKKRESRLEGPRGPIADPTGDLTRLAVPLAAAAIAEARQRTPEAELHLILVSSLTSPGESADGTQVGKSTAALARIVETALQALGSPARIHHIERETADAFQFGDLPELLVSIEDKLSSLRRPIVAAEGEAWPDHFHVSLSANTGTVALRAALQAGLRPHRPHLIHISDAYRWPFDAEGQPCPPSALTLDPDALAQRLPRRFQDLNPPSWKEAVEAMRVWKAEYIDRRPQRAAAERDPEANFWFRKGRKEVLAVLVTGPDDALVAHRALNLEVSLPTGTLCAERNAIGSALAAQPDLRRADLRAIAVLSLDEELGPRLGPCGACTEWLRKIAEVNPDFSIIAFGDLDCTRIYVDPVT